MKILIATHKKYIFPAVDYYIPIHVGKSNSALELNILSDNSGENISIRNNSFCELTALYWAWKNHFFDEADYVGLVHYRRYFSGKQLSLLNKRIASKTELLSDFVNYDGIVAKKRNYYIESVYLHYKNAHYAKDLDLVKEIIRNDYVDYIQSFEQVMSGKTLHLFNMFVLKRQDVEKYCQWLFDILFKLEKQIDITDYDNYQKRVFGFIAERLFNVWLVKNQLKLKERKVVSLEGEHILKKAIGLLKRKYLKKK